MVARCLTCLFWCFTALCQAAEGQFIRVNGVEVSSLTEAFALAGNGSVITLSDGEFVQAGRLQYDNVTLQGSGQTVIHSLAYAGKAALVLAGNNTTIKNIECHSIEVEDDNGACVRLSGRGLTLDNVYFHDSQQGLLTGENPGRVEIRDSTFENLGYGGLAHGIYVGGGQLYIRNSRFLASRGQGHEIKSRAASTVIESSVIASLGGDDSRLIDASNGGVLEIRDSILQQGPNSVNWNLIGFGLEGYRYDVNGVTLQGNLFLLDSRMNRVLDILDTEVRPEVNNNVFVGRMMDDYSQHNEQFRSRGAANLAPFPFLPSIPLRHDG